MTDQIERYFILEQTDKLQYFKIHAVIPDNADNKIKIKVLGFTEKSEALIKKLSAYFNKLVTSAGIAVEYNQITEPDVLLGEETLFLANVNHCTKNCSKQVKTIKLSNRNGQLHVVYHWDISSRQEQSLQESVSYIAERVGTICTYEKEKKTISNATAAQRNGQAKGGTADGYLLGKNTKAKSSGISELNEYSGSVTIKGYITSKELRNLKDKISQVLSLDITDYTSSITCEKYINGSQKSKKKSEFAEQLKPDQHVQIQGLCEYNKYKRENVIKIKSIALLENKKTGDNAEKKRVELHLHTKMSAMDGLVNIKELMSLASRYGHRAVGITDHGTVQSFPDAHIAAKKKGIKLLHGIEAYLFDDMATALTGASDMSLDGSFVVFDLETTGLNPQSDVITEIGAVRVQNNIITDDFTTFVNPERSIPHEIVKLTGITDSMVKGAPSQEEAVSKFLEFAGDSLLVAHNADFDMGFINTALQKMGIEKQYPYLDTMNTARRLMPTRRSFKLDKLCKDMNIKLESHHRAWQDANATSELMLKLFDILTEQSIETVDKINSIENKNMQPWNIFHTVIYAQNRKGLKNLYKLVSVSNLEYLYRGKPHIPKSKLIKLREGLLLGSACEAGELYKAIVAGRKDEKLMEIAKFYDYLEIQPLGNNNFMINSKKNPAVQSEDDLIKFNRKVVEIGQKMNIPVAATGDVHFLRSRDSVFRAILQNSMDYEDADNQPPLYYRSTEEMLKEFAYLGDDTAYEIVVEAPNRICDMMEDIEPLPPEKLYAPKMEKAEEQIVEMTYATARGIYGDELPEIVVKRLEKELNAITGFGYSVLYLIAHKLVKKSNEDGYIVGSRGSVGSSLVAHMTGITEVDPLPPHYTCDKCKYSDFKMGTNQYGCGPDMPDKECPVCSGRLTKRGFDIPFEVFLGFKGDKVPDIDLNFSGDNQSAAHKYTEVLFGKENVFRSGTISGVADKMAYAGVMKYLEHTGKEASRAEVNRLKAGCAGVKKTTGQHPGGIIVLPHEYEIYDFTPIQYPADVKDKGIITTHFTFNMLHDRLVKLDILGHDDPTMLKMLEELTGLDPITIPLDDKDTMGLFSSVKSLGVSEEDILAEIGTYGVPEFGTGFVRGMLKDTRPNTMAELVRISGLSHGTDVWLGNAQELVRSKTATLLEAICTRDDIMLALMKWNVDSKMAFDIMENVRKGKGLKPDMEQAMKDAKVSPWFINSCKLIKYMFPKAHAAAYVIMAFRIAYYKVHYPLEYYTAYFSIRGGDFNALTMTCDHGTAKKTVQQMRSKGNDMSAKEKGSLTVWEMVMEMLARGIRFTPVDLRLCKADKFLITEGEIMPPLNRLPNIGTSAAVTIEEKRDEEMFRTVEDMQKRANVNKAAMESLEAAGCLKGMPKQSQISFFD